MEPIPYQVADGLLDRMYARVKLVLMARRVLATWDRHEGVSPTQRMTQLSAAMEAMREVLKGASDG